MNDFHVMLLGSRAAGGFGLVFLEQLAITKDGRTSTGCGGIYDDAQIEGLRRVTAIIKDMDAVRAVWPERFPLTMRLGSDDLNEKGVQFDESVVAVGMMKKHGLDLADLSIGFNTDEMTAPPFADLAFMVERGTRVRREVGIPVGVSWNLGLPALADQVIREDLLDLIFLGRPALSNPHWPVWAARELGHGDPFSLVPEDWAWWLRNFRAHEACIGWPVAFEGTRDERKVA